MRRERRFETPAALAEGLAADLAAELRADLSDRGRSSLIVSGGRTPVRLFERLSRAALDWRRVSITLADERHDRSNARLVRDHLAQNRAAAASFIALWPPDSGDPAAMLKRLPRPFGAVVLGMGEDGHTASLFPGIPGLTGALDPASPGDFIEVPAAGDRLARLSLTLHALSDATQIVIAFDGPAKRKVFEEALQPGPIEALPVRAVLRQTRAPVDVYWSA